MCYSLRDHKELETTEQLNKNKCALVEYVMQQGFLYCLGLLYDRVLCILIEMLYGILLGYIIWICSQIECHMKVSMYADWACHMQFIYISAMERIRQTGQKKKKKKKGGAYYIVFMPKPEVLPIHLYIITFLKNICVQLQPVIKY